MVSRLQLTVTDFNSGANRKQAATKAGDFESLYKKSYSKVTKTCIVKKIPEQKHRNDLPSIMQEIALQKSLVENRF